MRMWVFGNVFTDSDLDTFISEAAPHAKKHHALLPEGTN